MSLSFCRGSEGLPNVPTWLWVSDHRRRWSSVTLKPFCLSTECLNTTLRVTFQCKTIMWGLSVSVATVIVHHVGTTWRSFASTDVVVVDESSPTTVSRFVCYCTTSHEIWPTDEELPWIHETESRPSRCGGNKLHRDGKRFFGFLKHCWGSERILEEAI